NLANDFRLLKTKTKWITEWSSYTGYTSVPQSLTVFPGLYEEILHQNLAYTGLVQEAHLKTFYTDNYYSIQQKKSKFGSQHKIGFNIQVKDFISDLVTLQSGVRKSPGSEYKNN